MVRNSNRSAYGDIMDPSGMGGSLKYRNPESPGSISKSRSKSPGIGRISNRTWSPGQATLFRRKKIEGETSVDDSLGSNKEEVDYLTLSLDAIEKSEKRSGRRPGKSRSIDRSATSSSSHVRRTPRKSYSTGNTRPRASANRSGSTSPSRRRSNGTRPPRRVLKSKSMDRLKPALNQKDLPMDIQRRLYAVTDPDISIKKKVERELEFMKGTPEEKRIYLQYRNHFDRQEFFDAQALDEQQKQDTIAANAREEKLREKEFLKTVERKRLKERRKEEEAKERERRAYEQAKMHSVETIASAMSDIKNAALEAATVSVARNQFQKKSYEEERRKVVENFRRNEGKHMSDVERTLKEARIEQEDPEEKRMKLRGGRPYRNI